MCVDRRIGTARLHARVSDQAIGQCSAACKQHSGCCMARNRGSEIFRSSLMDRPRFYLSRVIGQEVAPWRLVQKGRQVAVASSGLFPQPLWINACGKRRHEERMAGPLNVSSVSVPLEVNGESGLHRNVMTSEGEHS